MHKVVGIILFLLFKVCFFGKSEQAVAFNSSLPQYIIVNGPLSFCQGDSVLLQSVFTTGNQWLMNGIPITNSTGQFFAVHESGSYQVAVYQNGTWDYSDSVIVEVLSSPQMPVIDDTTVCSGGSLSINVAIDNLCSLNWFDDEIGGNLLGTGSQLQFASLFSDTSLYAEVVALNGCKSERALLNVFVKQKPVAEFNYTMIRINGGYRIEVFNTSLNADSYSWSYSDENGIHTSAFTHPVYTINGDGTFDITLTAINNFGCSDMVSKKIITGGSGKIFIPTTFTPNNDGKNDVFRIRGSKVKTLNLQVFDQWGGMLFDGGVNSQWDGTANGITVANGTYIYKARVEEEGKDESTYTGTITVIK